MRLALSAMAAASGLLLLALAFYGQPAAYIQQARTQWDMLMDYPLPQQQQGDTPTPSGPMDETSGAGETADAQRVVRLQEEVTRLEAELAARQANLQQPIGLPSPSDQGLQPQASKTAPTVVGATRMSAATQQPNISEAPPSLFPPSIPTRPEGPALSPSAISSAPLEVVTPGSSTATGSSAAGPSKSREAEASNQRTDSTQAGSRPSRSAAAARTTTGSDRRDSSDNPSPRSDPTRSDIPKADPTRSTSTKQVTQKAIPAPPPLPQTPQQPSSTKQQAADESEAVLARLRQNAQGAPPVQLTERSASSEPRLRSGTSTTVSRLNAAQAALGSGRVEEARRLLQEAQLQLVFRPMDTADEEPATSGHSAADVARALEALSASDMPSSRRYIDAAVDDLSGSTIAPRLQDASRHNPGYAPAYPPR